MDFIKQTLPISEAVNVVKWFFNFDNTCHFSFESKTYAHL